MTFDKPLDQDIMETREIVRHIVTKDGTNPDGVDFGSREAASPSQRPRLRVTYVPAERR